MAIAGSVSTSGISSSLDNLSDEVKNTSLSEPVFEVHNEMVGDKIYTTVKQHEARENAKTTISTIKREVNNGFIDNKRDNVSKAI